MNGLPGVRGSYTTDRTTYGISQSASQSIVHLLYTLVPPPPPHEFQLGSSHHIDGEMHHSLY